jgi:hypothetical protein
MRIATACALIMLGCGQEGSAPPAPLVPVGWRSSFAVVRDCRGSVDHDLAYVVVRASESAAAVYDHGPYPFALGAVVLKEQYADPGCTQLVGFTAMRKEEPGFAAALGDWRWQRLDADRAVIEDGAIARCASCHAASTCRDFACADP